MKTSDLLPMAAAVTSVLALQVGAAFSKTMFPLVGPEGLAALRTGIAAILLCAALQPWRIELPYARWRVVLIYGAMIGAMNLLIYRAILYLPIGVALSIEVIGPLGVAVLSSRRKADFLWIAFALAGLALLPLGRVAGGLDPKGLVFALLAALCWAIYILVGSKVADLGGRGVAIGMLIATFITAPLGLAHSGSALFEPQILALGLSVALLSSALPFLLDIYALRHLRRSVFGVLMSASPAISALAGMLILGEHLSALQWAGILSITIACLGSTVARAHQGTAPLANANHAVNA